MRTVLFIAWTVVGYAAVFTWGYLLGREDDRKRDRAWSDGYAAGIVRGEDLSLRAAKRWEMP